MENPIEHLDLGLVNFTKHPSNPDYVVYRFTNEEKAKSFHPVTAVGVPVYTDVLVPELSIKLILTVPNDCEEAVTISQPTEVIKSPTT